VIKGMKTRARPLSQGGNIEQGEDGVVIEKPRKRHLSCYLLRKPTEIQLESGFKVQENADAPPTPTGEYRRSAD